MKSSDNTFLPGILEGVFRVMAEVTPPLAAMPLAEARQIVACHARALADDGWFYAILLDDRPDEAPRVDADDVYAAIAENFPGPVVRMLSGKGRTPVDAKSLLLDAGSRNERLFCMASGDGRPLAKVYLDSVDALKLCHGELAGIVAGATVNISKYTAPDIALSYAKLSRKIRSGAKFFFCQATWDMKKAQELQWELQLRDTMAPVVARVVWLSRDNLITPPTPPLPPGVAIPELYLRDIRSAYTKGDEEGRRFQAKALAMIMTGFKRLGFSGVLLSGDHSSQDRNALHEEFEKAQGEFPDYNAWNENWHGLWEQLMLPPVRSPRYLFAKLLTHNMRDPEMLDFDPASALDVGKASLMDRFVSSCLRYAANPSVGAGTRRFICRLCGVDPRGLPMLGPLGYLPSHECPKGLTEGACGNVSCDGHCECNPRKLCFFRRVFALASHRGRLADMEN